MPRFVSRAITMIVSVGAVAAMVAGGLLSAGGEAPALTLAPTGHWVFNRSEHAALHIDPGTGRVDAAVTSPDLEVTAAGPAPMVLAGADNGYVLAANRVTVFGKSSLTVDAGYPVPDTSAEMPVGIETVGGPYLVYRSTGVVVRLGPTPVTVQSGGPLGRPTHTDDGTVWLQRADNGDVSRLPAEADRADYVTGHPADRRHALTVVDDTAAIVDLAADTLTPVSAGGAGTARPLGLDLPDDALVADRTTADGFLPVITPNPSRLVLIPLGAAAAARGGAPTTVDLPPGSYQPPLATDDSTAVVNTSTNTLATISSTGSTLDRTPVDGGASARLSRGADGNAYLDDDRGRHTYVVGRTSGAITPVGTTTVPDVPTAAPAARRVPVTPPARRLPTPDLSPAVAPVVPAVPVVPAGPAVAPADPPARPADVPVVPPSGADPPRTGGNPDPVVPTGIQVPVAPPADEPVSTPPVDVPEVVPVRPEAESAPAGPPGPPSGLSARATGATDARTVSAQVTWAAPTGVVDGFVVEVDGGVAARPTTTSATVTLPGACTAHRIAVQAVRTAAAGAGDGGQLIGEAVTTTVPAYWPQAQCLPAARTVTARSTGGKAIAVKVAGADTRYLEADCTVLLGSTRMWQGTCAAAANGITVNAPAYDTSYTVSVRATNDHGTSTGDAVTVRTGPDPTATQQQQQEEDPPQQGGTATTTTQPTYGPQQIVYRVSSQNGGTSHEMPSGASMSQIFTADVDVVDTIGVIVGIDPKVADPGTAHTLTLQLIGGGRVVAQGSLATRNNVETRLDITGTKVTRGATYTLKVINTSSEPQGFYTNPPGTGTTPDVAPGSARVRITDENGHPGTTTSSTSALSGIVLGRSLQ